MLNIFVDHTRKTLFQVFDSSLDKSDKSLVAAYYCLLLSYPWFGGYKLSSHRTPMDVNPSAVWETLPNLYPATV